MGRKKILSSNFKSIGYDNMRERSSNICEEKTGWYNIKMLNFVVKGKKGDLKVSE